MGCLLPFLRSMRERPAVKGAALFLVYFLLIALTLRRTLHYGFTGDESGYVAPNTWELASHLWLPFIFSRWLDTGHPVIYTYPVAVLWKIFGQSNAVANIVTWAYAALALVAAHLLTERILARRAGTRAQAWGGAAAALSLYSTPVFISHAAQYLDPMPYVALTLWMTLAWVDGRRKVVAVLGGLLSLIRITGCLSVLGLGLFDLAYTWLALRRRTWRGALGALAPYLGSAGIFLGYLFFKLVVFGRPLTTFSDNNASFTDWAGIQRNINWVLFGIYRVPLHGFIWMLGIAAVALAVSAVKRLLQAKGAAGGETPQPGAGGIYGAGLATMAIPTIFFCCYHLFPQPRWFIMYHALFVIMGVHGLMALTGRRAWLVAPLLGLWCGAQVMRWHEHWVERYGAHRIPSICKGSNGLTPLTMDIVYRKELNHKAAEWIKEHTENPILICNYPTGSVFRDETSGYGAPCPNVTGVEWLRQMWQEKAKLNALLETGKKIYVVSASWDLEGDLKAMNELKRKARFKEVYRKRNKADEWIRIYRVRRVATDVAATSGSVKNAASAKAM